MFNLIYIQKGIIDMPDENKSIETSNLVQDDTNSEIRSSVAKLCQDFQGEYWRNLDSCLLYTSPSPRDDL